MNSTTIIDRAKHAPYLTAGPVPKQYPWLDENQYCDVGIVGNGLTAALCALRLAEKGRSVIVLADGAIGFGENACMTASAQADRCVTLTDLSRRFPTDTSLRLYTLGAAALDELENLCRSLDASEGKDGFPCGFARRDTLLYTDDDSELPSLDREYLARKHNGFDCTYITREMARDSFSFDIGGGILSKDFGAVLNPYHLTHLCLMRAEQMGAKVFEHTDVTDIETPSNGDGSVKISTAVHRTVYADRLILATGSRGLESVLPDFRRRTRYFTVSRPIPSEEVSGWPGECLINTFGAPRLRYSITPDGRIAADGAERRFFGAGSRLRALLQMSDSSERRWADLEESTEYLFPAIPRLQPAFECTLSYTCAPDGLPVIGTRPAFQNCFFALCSGPGLPIDAVIAAQFAADMIEGLHSDDMDFFKVLR